MSLLLTLSRCHTLFWCSQCWLWTSRCRMGLVKITIFLGLVYVIHCAIWYHLYSLKNVKRPRRSVTFSIVVTLLKVTLFLECFSRFLSCRNGTKLCKGCHIENRTSFLKIFHSISMFSWFVVYFYFLWKVTVIRYFWKVTVNIWNKSIIIIIRVYLFHSNSKSRINVN